MMSHDKEMEIMQMNNQNGEVPLYAYCVCRHITAHMATTLMRTMENNRFCPI